MCSVLWIRRNEVRHSVTTSRMSQISSIIVAHAINLMQLKHSILQDLHNVNILHNW